MVVIHPAAGQFAGIGGRAEERRVARVFERLRQTSLELDQLVLLVSILGPGLYLLTLR